MKPLTKRQSQVAGYLAEARRNQEIAFLLGLTVGTVKQYVSAILRKLRMRNRGEIAMWWLSSGQNSHEQQAA